MEYIWQILSVLSGLLAFWKYWLTYQENLASKNAAEKDQRRDTALDDLKKAETEQEIDDALDRIVDNKP